MALAEQWIAHERAPCSGGPLPGDPGGSYACPVSESGSPGREPVVLPPGAGRAYEMGGMHAVFKADGLETRHQYNVSEWWLEPHTLGPGAHSHDEDDVFYVIEGTMDFLVDDDWVPRLEVRSSWSPAE